MNLDLADDYLVFDNLRKPTLTYRDSGDEVVVQDAEENGQAVRLAISKREAATSNGRYQADDVRFHLPTAIVTTQPQPGDVITDEDAIRYTILDVTKATLGTRWACSTRALAVTHRLVDRVTIQRLIESVGRQGEPKVSYEDWLVNLAANMQPMDSGQAEQHEQRFTRASYLCRLEQQLPEIDASQYRVRWNGKTYSVDAIRNPERIDELTELDLTDTPWPL